MVLKETYLVLQSCSWLSEVSQLNLIFLKLNLTKIFYSRNMNKSLTLLNLIDAYHSSMENSITLNQNIAVKVLDFLKELSY